MAKSNAQLVKDNEALMEELYASGVRKRPTLQLEIEECEKRYYEKLMKLNEAHAKKQAVLIKECEDKTGRSFGNHITANIEAANPPFQVFRE